MKDVIGIVLGGGKGTRLYPLTRIRSKPAVPLGGKYRLVDIPISNCINSGINRIYVLTQYNSASLNRHVNLTYRFGLFNSGFVDILAAEQTPESVRWYQGTADAVRQTLRHVLDDRNIRHVLILSGDQLYRMNFTEVMQKHLQRQAGITVCVIPVSEQRASAFGILKLNPEGRIVEFEEKPSTPEKLAALRLDARQLADLDVPGETPLLASMGIYLFSREALIDSLADETKLDFGSHVIPAALSEHKVMGHVFQGYWEDIGTIRSFFQANLDLASPTPPFNFYDSKAPIYTHPRFLPGSRVERCQITSSIISDGCYVRDCKVSGSVVGIRSIIGAKTEISRSLLLGADYYEDEPFGGIPIGIGEGTRIHNAIVDKNARIGRGVSIANAAGVQDHDAENYSIREGIVIVAKNATIPDGTEI